LDQPGIEPHNAAIRLDRRTGRRETGPRLGQQDADAELGQDPQRHAVHLLDLVVGEDAQWREGIDQPAVGQAAAGGAGAAPAPPGRPARPALRPVAGTMLALDHRRCLPFSMNNASVQYSSAWRVQYSCVW